MRAALCFCAALIVVGCYFEGIEPPTPPSDDDGSSDSSGDLSYCAIGEAKACLCPGGHFGSQLCHEDGAHWGECDCSRTDEESGDFADPEPDPEANGDR